MEHDGKEGGIMEIIIKNDVSMEDYLKEKLDRNVTAKGMNLSVACLIKNASSCS